MQFSIRKNRLGNKDESMVLGKYQYGPQFINNLIEKINLCLSISINASEIYLLYLITCALKTGSAF